MSKSLVNAVLLGVGNIGRPFLQLVLDKANTLYYRYGLRLLIVGLVDSSGAALNADGIDIKHALEAKASGQGVAHLDIGCPGMPARKAVQESGASLLLDASPTNLIDGQPGLGAVEAAIEAGMNVVCANKGPLVLAYSRLMRLAQQYGVSIRYSAAAAAACPTINLGQRDLAGSDIARVDGVYNMTTNYILCQMADQGLTFGEALAQAQAKGIAEADPTLDVDGWDTANKLVILANGVLGIPAKLKDVSVTGIRDVEPEDLRRAQSAGGATKLVASAIKEGDDYRFIVAPTALGASHPLAKLTADQLGIVYETDTQGTICAIAGGQGTLSTAAAMLRDVIDLYRIRI